MKVCDESNLHVFDISLASLSIVLLPLIGEDSRSQFEDGVAVAFKSLVGLSAWGDSISRDCPIEILRENIILEGLICLELSFHSFILERRNHLFARLHVVAEIPGLLGAHLLSLIASILLFLCHQLCGRHLSVQGMYVIREKLIVNVLEVACFFKIVEQKW